MDKNDDKIIRDNGEVLNEMIYLAVCGMKNLTPDYNLIKNVDFEKLYNLSSVHSLSALVCKALEDCVELSNHLDDKTDKYLKLFQQKKFQSIRKNILLDVKRKELYQYLDSNGIWYMSLKGIVIKDLYPDIGLREMADNDILFDRKYRDEVRRWFESDGFTGVDIGVDNHDVYEKRPIYNYEMHILLFSDRYHNKWYQYYRNVEDRLIHSNQSMEVHLSPEDFYIYFMLHGYKHYTEFGIGIRFLTDLYVILKKYAKKMDWDYIRQECKKTGIQEFESVYRKLTVHVFRNPDMKLEHLSEREKREIMFLGRSGVHGTREQRLNILMSHATNSNGKVSKVRYYLNRMFPSAEFMRMHYPPFGRHKIFLPVGWMYRLIKNTFTKKQKLKEEVRYLMSNGVRPRRQD